MNDDLIMIERSKQAFTLFQHITFEMCHFWPTEKNKIIYYIYLCRTGHYFIVEFLISNSFLTCEKLHIFHFSDLFKLSIYLLRMLWYNVKNVIVQNVLTSIFIKF